MEVIKYEHVEETLYRKILDNGLEVVVLHKPDFKKTYATFSTKYGSIDNHFSVGDQPEIRVPDGIAHFLEHKMFEEPEGYDDVFTTFAKYGASANAYTSFDRTVYLFSATDHIQENVLALVDYVQRPYFTEENVNKEKGIIEQEINMYGDNPDWRVYYGLIEALYQKIPVRIDIAGTVESIYKIDKDTLYRCYETFYHPQNMLLFVVGHESPEKIISLVEENQKQKNFKPLGEINRYFEKEPNEVAEKRKIKHLPVSMPKVMMGFKEKEVNLSGEELVREEVITKLLLDIIFSSSSKLYQQLYDEKIIFDSFGFEYNCSPLYSFSVIGGDTPNPDLLVTKVSDAIKELQQKGIAETDFERVKRKKVGNYLRMLNSPEAIASEYTKFRFRQADMFNVLKYYQSCTIEDVNRRLKEHFDFDQLAISIVESAPQA